MSLELEQEPHTQLSQELQKVLLTAEFAATRDDDYTPGETGDGLMCLSDQTFEKWVPYLRQAVESDRLDGVVEEVYSSVEENFQNFETQILQDSQVSDNLSSSIDEIERIQNLAESYLQGQVADLQAQLSASTNEVVSKKRALTSNRRTSIKISESIILIEKIFQMLELTNKCQELIRDGNFYKALQNLDKLERIYIHDFKNYKFEFLAVIYNSIPKLKNIIKDESINLIKKSLSSNLEKTLSQVGQTYFQVYNDQLLPHWLAMKKAMKLSNYKFNSPVEVSLRDDSFLAGLKLEDYYNLDEFYDSIMIFESLKETNYLCDEFTKEYDFRKVKLVYPLDWKSTTTMTHSANEQVDSFYQQLSLPFLKEYLLKILGFLLYDKFLHKSTDYIFAYNTYTTTEEFWEQFMTKVSPHLSRFIKEKLTTEDQLIEFKNFLGILIAILENMKLNSESMYKIQVQVFEKYCGLLIHVFDKEFTNLLNDDDFMPLPISDRNFYEKVMKLCWMKPDSVPIVTQDDANGFSVTLPFSPLYPMTCALIKKSYANMLLFLNTFFQHDLSYLNIVLVRTVDDIFIKVVNNKIRSKLDTTSREEIAQILINLDYFIVAAKEFSDIMTKENITQNPDIEIKLSSTKQLADTKKYAETKLIELIDSKVTDLMEFVELDWTTEEVRDEPGLSIRDIAQFLEMMFTSTLANLPYSIKSLLIFREFDQLTRKFLELLVHESPSYITTQSVANFETDMKFLENVISNIFPNESTEQNVEISPSTPTTPVADSFNVKSPNMIESNVRSLFSTFTDLNQHILLMKSNNFDEYKDSSIRMRKYPRIKPEVAHLLMNKLSRPTTATTDGDNTTVSDYSVTSNGRFAKFFNRGG
ncbi:AFR251Cp [Eremothecium gossypii ATCC 10895]|uniref:Exocyst complex component SEC15 n=1 Tax=Eremothecium gossypii (strain ATCC 10895 / CBS 109.51 / FGSC 9923 / NRRL Y-1056) TaxID=284811 RepID=Q753S5_EREGS|nr:AFR251Cp [Eremothecium gossypii ATCC 10895]AAS53622.2 AFR251Cp [Eremothecium gossypii ATCC 10895]AEY97935.1 FAFR251Cp [Eremothecium gossypii FDAG1]